MPEIPEMEIYHNYLVLYAAGLPINKVNIVRERSTNVSPEIFERALTGAEIVKVERAAKNILIYLSTGKALAAHMMLDGRIYLQAKGEPADLPGKSHISLELSNGSVLHFCDMRLGFVKLLELTELQKLIAEIGVDPLSAGYTYTKFLDILSRKKGMIKPILMDQRVIAGIGNAYSNEILFHAGILPERKVSEIIPQEKEKLFRTIPEVLNEAIKHGGYIEERFASWDEKSGGAIAHFKVYDRTGLPCYTCNSFIQHKVVGGRNAFYCEVCQK